MLIGNLTRDPNLRFTPTGTAVCSFGIATNRSVMSGDNGEREERVDFHNIVSWAKLAEICGQLLHKGDKVYVEGRIQTRDWKGDDGQDRRITEIVIDHMMLLYSPSGRSSVSDNSSYSGTKKSDDNTTKTKSSQSDQSDQVDEPVSDNVDAVEDVSDDIPF